MCELGFIHDEGSTGEQRNEKKKYIVSFYLVKLIHSKGFCFILKLSILFFFNVMIVTE